MSTAAASRSDSEGSSSKVGHRPKQISNHTVGYTCPSNTTRPFVAMLPRSMPRKIPFFALVFLATAVTSAAQTVQTSSTTLPVASAAPVTGGISIDGKLDEPAWSQAKPITDFRQQQPREGLPAS